jgi:NodT family efflux transporter outer membrane factor (OMF) lipoprotein
MATAPSTRHALARAVLIAAVLTLCGCTTLKSPPSTSDVLSRELPQAATPEAWKAAASQGVVADGWLTSFGDERLVALAQEALRHNTDLRVAATRVDAAAAGVKAAGGSVLPEVNLIGRTGGKATGSSGQLSGALLSASWELDLWGRLRYGQRAAQDQYASTEADLRAARQSLVATFAKAWFLSAEASQQKRLVSDMLANGERLVALAEQRQRGGIGSEAEVALARGSLQNYRDTDAQIDYGLAQSRRALEMLLGRYPAAELGLPALLAELPPAASTGIPSELIERRPDIVAAQRRVAAASARSGEAGAAKLPRLSLSAALSSISSSTFVLKSIDNPSLGVGATAVLPIFNGGQLDAAVDLRQSEQRQAEAAFGVTVQRAFNEVEAALSAEESLATRERILRAGVVEQARALTLEEQRYRVGSRDLRSVAQQQLAATAAAMTLLRVETEQRVQRVQLHLALGGDVLASATK